MNADTDPDADDVTHDLGGIAAEFAGADVFKEPESARFVVETLATVDGALVDVKLRSDGMNARTVLEPAAAKALADRLATAAAEAETSD